MRIMKKEGVIYTRVSSQKQVSEGNGLSSQHSACLRYANENNIEIIGSFQDAAFTGQTADRPGIHELMDFVESRAETTWVIFDDISRLSRNASDYYFIKFYLLKHGGRLICLSENLISQDPIDELKEHFSIGLAQFDRKRNQQRVNARMRERVRAGFWVFRPPIGMVFKDKLLCEDGKNSVLIKQIFNDFASGRHPTYESVKSSKIARQLINPKSLRPYKLKEDQIKRLLTNKIYVGVIDYPKWGIKGVAAAHKGFIDPRLFQRVQERIKGKGKKKYSSIGLEHFPLKGDLECGSCSQKLVAQYSTGRNKKYPYYRCNSSKAVCKSSPKSVRREVLHDEFRRLLKSARIKTELLELADRILADTFNKRSAHQRDIKSQNDLKLASLGKRREEQLEKVIAARNLSVIAKLESEIESIDSQIEALTAHEPLEDDLSAFRASGCRLLKQPDLAWEEADVTTKKLIVDFVFEGNLKVAKGRIGTAQYSLPYRLLAGKKAKSGSLVDLLVQNWNQLYPYLVRLRDLELVQLG